MLRVKQCKDMQRFAEDKALQCRKQTQTGLIEAEFMEKILSRMQFHCAAAKIIHFILMLYYVK